METTRSSTMRASGAGPGAPSSDALASFVAATERNPFVLPSDEEVFRLRETERQHRDDQRHAQASQKLWERADASSTLTMTRKMIQQIGE
jgi:hypothetical protein